MSAWSLLSSPAVLTVDLRPGQNAPLPLVLRRIRSFGNALSPVEFSAQTHSTSELLRFL